MSNERPLRRRINLDERKAARAAQAEADAEPIVVEFGGEEFTLPSELPADFGFGLAEGDGRGAMRSLFGEDDYTRFNAHRPSMDDITALTEGIAEAYGMEGAGESAASGGSSSNNGKPSRPTSKLTTAST